MIITLKGADFSASNIGALSSWRISRSLGSGATYEGVTSVDKGAAFSATVTLAEGYEVGAAGVTVTMGGAVLSGAHSISGNVITITIAEVTGNVLIKVPTVNTATGEEEEPDEPDYPTETIWYTNMALATNPSAVAPASAGGSGFATASETMLSAMRNQPINAVRICTDSKGTYTVTVGVVDSQSATQCNKILNGTFTKTTTTKEVVIIKFPETVTLSNTGFMIFEPYTANNYFGDKGYTFYRATKSTSPVAATGTLGFYSRLPNNYGNDSTPAWSKNENANIGVDFGYVID